jgi:hypothetical protein
VPEGTEAIPVRAERLESVAREAEGPVAASAAGVLEVGGAETSLFPALDMQLVGLVSYASEPGHALDGRLQLEISRDTGLASWLLAAGLGYSAGEAESARLGTADLALFTGQLGLCPPGVTVVGLWWLRGCAQARAGGLRFAAPTARLEDVDARWRPWASAGVGLHSGIPLASAISLRWLAEASFLLVRDEFVTETPASPAGSTGSSPFHEPDLISLNLGLGVAYAF